MVRTQIQLTEVQAATLRSMAANRRVPVAELIRMSIDHFVEREAASSREALVARAKNAVGRFSSESADGSSNHDEHLANAFGAR